MSEGEQEAFRMIPQDVRKKARRPLSAAAKAIEAHNDAYYASLTEEEKKEFDATAAEVEKQRKAKKAKTSPTPESVIARHRARLKAHIAVCLPFSSFALGPEGSEGS